LEESRYKAASWRRSMLRLYGGGFSRAPLAAKLVQLNIGRSAFKPNLLHLAIDSFALCALY
jgi:hypothetical protein